MLEELHTSLWFLCINQRALFSRIHAKLLDRVFPSAFSSKSPTHTHSPPPSACLPLGDLSDRLLFLHICLLKSLIFNLHLSRFSSLWKRGQERQSLCCWAKGSLLKSEKEGEKAAGGWWGGVGRERERRWKGKKI